MAANKGESKTRQEDADDWFFNSFKRYQNLNMFELEAPIDTMQFIDPTSLCITGVQAYSKKCEILQMAVPPKLLPKHIEDGLCKDRDFKILCGGYSSSRIVQAAPFGPGIPLIAATQEGQCGMALFKLGDENHGVILEESVRLTAAAGNLQSGGKIAIGTKYLAHADDLKGDRITLWLKDAIEKGERTASVSAVLVENYGGVEKIRMLEDNTFACVTDRGNVCLFDVRDSMEKPKILIKMTTDDCEIPFRGNQAVCYTFDAIEQWSSVCVVNTQGSLEVHDLRRVKDSGNEDKQETNCVTKFFLTQTKTLGSGFYQSRNQVLSGKFNLQFQNASKIYTDNTASSKNDFAKFIITGFKEDIVPVYKLSPSGDISTIFIHDGHVKTVTEAIWHQLSDNLIFSTSTDSVLHAWQFFENEDGISE